MPQKTIAKFTVRYLQVLNEKGVVDEKLEPKLRDDELVELHRAMYLARQFDQRMLKMQRQGRLGTIPVCAGQEASVCGATLAMRETDWFVGAYREIGGRLMRGEPLVNPLLVYNGYEEGNFQPANDRTLPISIVLGSQLPIAVGIAYAMRMKGEKDTAVVTFFGDGATSEGDFHEAMNFAGVWKVPVVFICQNNQWAISTPRVKQTAAESYAQKAFAYGMQGIQVDGNDALAVYRATEQALERARKGDGPTLIESVTYRMGVHTTADDPKRYREDREVVEWEKRDPLTRFEKYLEAKKLWNARKQKALEEEVRQQIEEAVKEFENMTDFKPDAPFDYTFGVETAEMEAQRKQFLEELRKEKEDA